LLERKPRGFDFAKPLKDWHPPPCFDHLRRRLEADDRRVTRAFIPFLRLLARLPAQCNIEPRTNLPRRLGSGDNSRTKLPNPLTNGTIRFHSNGKKTPLFRRKEDRAMLVSDFLRMDEMPYIEGLRTYTSMR
jgi:hypothetical protein